MDEEILLATSLDGDLEAFNQLVLHHQDLAYSISYYLLADEDAAAGAVQASVIKAFGALESCRPGNFKNWLLGIVIHTCCNCLRKAHSHRLSSLTGWLAHVKQSSSLPAAARFPEDAGWLAAPCEWLVAGMRTLPAEQRVALVLHDLYGYSYPEVAEISDIPVATVKSRLSQARAGLRDCLLRHRTLFSTEQAPGFYLPVMQQQAPAAADHAVMNHDPHLE
jgi:RNA polymerase sigma-70 factor, ECF subfamily